MSLTAEMLDTRVRRYNLRYAYRTLHPLDWYKLIPLLEQEWGARWWERMDAEAHSQPPEPRCPRCGSRHEYDYTGGFAPAYCAGVEVEAERIANPE